MTGAQMISALGAANQAVSGMTYAEAAAALGAAAQGTEGGLTSIATFPLKYQEYGQVTIEAQYAAQLWDYWKTVAGAEGTTVLGAAAGAAVSYANGVLIGTGEGLAATAGLLTLSVPTAVAMAVPLLGVGMGIALYETNPEFWTKISNAVVDCCNKGSETISALITEAGQILLPKNLVDSIKQLFEDENVPMTGDDPEASEVIVNGDGGQWTLDSPSYKSFQNTVSPPREREISSTALAMGVYEGERTFISTEPFDVTTTRKDTGASTTSHITTKKSINYEGIRYEFYYSKRDRSTGFSYDPPLVNLHSITDGAIASMCTGTVTPKPAAEYPEGLSKWGGAEVDLDVIGTWPAYDPEFGTTRPYYPVTLPIGDVPGTTGNPEPTTDPTRPLAPVEIPEINPYIPPVVSPEIQWPDVNPQEVPVPEPGALVNPIAATDPIHVPEPVLDPATDPATEPEPLPEPETEYPETDGKPPQPGGISPPIIFPIPDPGGGGFPTISPPASETPVVSGEPGFVQVYHPTPSELIAFGRWLWVTYADATIDKIWNNPFDGVIGCHELYATPTDGGYTTIRCGFLDSGVSSQLVRVRYSTINCGSMIIPEYWGNYLDYSPYTKAYIYLPFIGIQELDADDIIGSAVNVCYHIDAYNGSCIAQITCAKDDYENTLYQFSGNCAVEYPLSGGSQAAIKAAMMTGDAYQAAANTAANATMWGGIGSGLASAVGGIAGGIATGLTGNVAGGISHGISGIASGIGQAIGGYASSVGQRAYGQAQHTASMLSGKSIVQHSGNFGASYGAMGIKKPYIFIRRPIQKVVNNYNVLYGYPAHKQVIIGNCEGFLRCREVHVISPLATDGEKAIIEQLLTTGVYVTDDFS